MRRLFALIKKIGTFTPEQQNILSAKIGILRLLPGEWLPDDFPPQSWIFVEDGFLLFMEREKDRWACRNFYWEGCSTVAYTVGAADLVEGSFQVQAVEPSVICYLTPDDERSVSRDYFGFSVARSVLSQRSYQQHCQRNELFKYDALLRIICVQRYFSMLLRAPEEDLADFLRLEDKKERMALIAMHRLERARRSYK